MYIPLHKKAFILAPVLVFSAIAVLFMSAALSWTSTNIKSAQNFKNKQTASDIAEAGIDYYRWHLAHAPTDYKDGTTTSGPYVHDYYDKDGVKIGQYSLAITAPPIGSSLVTIIATGTVTTATPTISKVIKAQFAKASIAKYATVANDDMRFGAGTIVYGLLHSNGGIHFDGVAYNLVSSAESTYVDPDDGRNHYAVYTGTFPSDPTPPTAITNNRYDVFTAGRQMSVPSVDFVGITSDINSMKTSAQTASRYWASSGKQGYHVVLKTNDTFDLYKVNTVTSLSNSCSSNNTSQDQAGWGSWTISTQSLIGNYSFPTTTGIVFFEDNVWVDGSINGARLTIVAAKPGATSGYPDITVNNDVTYTNYDGSDVLALIAQGDMNVGYGSDDNLRIDAAIVAQNGRVGRFYYDSSCGSNYIRNSLLLYGMIATNVRYGFAYTDNTGYTNRTISYDSNLLYAPPPSFPLTTDQYSLVSWQELQ